jgi:hypothetical protein
MCLACDLSTKNNRYNISRRSLVGGAATVFAASALFESISSLKAKELSAKNPWIQPRSATALYDD